MFLLCCFETKGEVVERVRDSPIQSCSDSSAYVSLSFWSVSGEPSPCKGRNSRRKTKKTTTKLVKPSDCLPISCLCFIAFPLNLMVEPHSVPADLARKHQIRWSVERLVYYIDIPTALILSMKSAKQHPDTFRFRFRFFIHQVLQQGKCLESGKHTNISKQQHWHTSTSNLFA